MKNKFLTFLFLIISISSVFAEEQTDVIIDATKKEDVGLINDNFRRQSRRIQSLEDGVSLTSGVTGILPIANGGTNAATANAALNNLLPSQGGNSGKYLTTDASNASWGAITQNIANYIAAATYIEVTAATERTINSGVSQAYTKLKEISALQRAGTITVTYDFKNDNPNGKARLYINGVAVGAENTAPDTAYHTYTDTPITVAVNDLVQVYGQTTTGTTYVKNFIIKVANPTFPSEVSGF